MKQALYGLLMFVFLALPFVRDILESIMIVHMHMQMPLLVVSGFLMARFCQIHCAGFFQKWNGNGVPGIILFVIIASYWMIPRAMDEAISVPAVEVFKFISLPFLAGIPLRDSWKKLKPIGKNIVYTYFALLFLLTGWLYVAWDDQLCNNYLVVDQKTLGWGSLAIAACIIIYLLLLLFTDQSEYE